MDIIIKHLSISIGKQDLFHDENVGIAPGAKVGIIGRNGVGKSTLLKAIVGKADYNGKIDYSGKVGYFPQHVELDPEATFLQELERGLPTSHHATRIQEIETLMGDPKVYTDMPRLTALTEEYTTLQTRVQKESRSRHDMDVQEVLSKLKIPESIFSLKTKELSTGQRAILALAKIFSADCDILLLDEPTNHLDFDRLAILEDYLRSFKGTVLVVTHDRFLLNRVADTILKIENGKILKFNGNYDTYLRARVDQFYAQQKVFANEQNYRRVQLEKINRIGTAPKNVRQSEYRRKMLDAREKVAAPDMDKSAFAVRFDSKPMKAPYVMETKDLDVGYEEPLIRRVTFAIGARQRFVIIGPNGCGKTTFLKTIARKIPPLEGKITFSSETIIGYADQDLQGLNETKTLYEEIYALLPDQALARANLSMIGFKSTEEVERPISSLSMGEKSRLNLLKILLHKPNFLLLDEPTNHLDIDAREIIENAFLHYNGTILAVSHDRYFIHKVANRVVKIENKRLIDVPKKLSLSSFT
ncbi:MAG: ABC-F family ATP-binding cassette domain-containing protein [Candidatus Diapherotrites archaeon]|nr:ABC-F family ATP-binding cassette domain-containing protein [Candidatus Diapherotrites archaeon]